MLTILSKCYSLFYQLSLIRGLLSGRSKVHSIQMIRMKASPANKCFLYPGKRSVHLLEMLLVVFCLTETVTERVKEFRKVRHKKSRARENERDAISHYIHVGENLGNARRLPSCEE